MPTLGTLSTSGTSLYLLGTSSPHLRSLGTTIPLLGDLQLALRNPKLLGDLLVSFLGTSRPPWGTLSSSETSTTLLGYHHATHGHPELL